MYSLVQHIVAVWSPRQQLGNETRSLRWSSSTARGCFRGRDPVTVARLASSRDGQYCARLTRRSEPWRSEICEPFGGRQTMPDRQFVRVSDEVVLHRQQAWLSRTFAVLRGTWRYGIEIRAVGRALRGQGCGDHSRRRGVDRVVSTWTAETDRRLLGRGDPEPRRPFPTSG